MPVRMRNQTLLLRLLLLLPLLRKVTLELQPRQQQARNSSLERAHPMPIVRRLAVGSRAGHVPVQLWRRKEMADVDLGTRNRMIMRRRRCRDGGWGGEARSICKMLGKMDEVVM